MPIVTIQVTREGSGPGRESVTPEEKASLIAGVSQLLNDVLHKPLDSTFVVIEEVEQREGRDDLVDVHAILYVERDSQKGIVIGKGGARLREVGTAARTQIEKLLGTKVYLDLRVKIAKNWQRDPKQLGRLGF